MARHLKNLLQTIDRANKLHHLIKKGDRVVVAASGGPDSTALLLALSKLKRKYNLTLVAAHLNHGLQGKSGDRFVRQTRHTCEQLEIPFYSKRVSIKKISDADRKSIEETGRGERYKFFLEIVAKTKSSKIATAHTLDDQTETVLLRMLRGSGLRGLSGIPFKRPEGKATVIRPLLLSEKKDLLSVLKEAGLSFEEDPTNRKTIFTRNRVRKSLLPLLERSFNPSVKEALSGLGSACSQAQDFIEQKAAAAFKGCARIKRRVLSLSIPRLSRLHPALRNEVFFHALRAVKGNLTRFTQSQIEGLQSLLVSGSTELRLNLPGVQVRKTRGELRLTPAGNGAIIPSKLSKKTRKRRVVD